MVNNGNGIIGTFVFRNEGDGCLNAKYMNEHEMLPYGETCVLQDQNRNHQGFIGNYSTTWFEQNQINQTAVLSINPNNSNNAGNANSFVLEWRRNGNLIFKGIGMVYGEVLVGAYWGTA